MANIDKGKLIASSFKKLVQERSSLNKTWSESYQYTYPVRGEGFLGVTDDGTINLSKAQTKQAELFDSTATDSVRLLASSALSGLTPTNSQWFGLAIPNVEEEQVPHDVREWLQNASSKLFTKIHSSNYESQALEFMTDVVVAGMAGLYVELNDEQEFKFEAWPLHSMYVQDLRGKGHIDTVYRRVCLTPSESIARYGKQNLPEAALEEYKKDPYSNKKFPYVHAIRPRFNSKGRQLSGFNANGQLTTNSKKMAWESVYVCEKSGKIVKESGYPEMPVIVPRWSKIPETDYALGAVYDALPDIKTLNALMSNVLLNADMIIAGAYTVIDDGVVNPNTTRIRPRQLIPVSSQDSIKPLSGGGDLNFAIALSERLQGSIRKVLLADQLGPTEKMNMTATEVETRTNIIRTILGPIFGRLQAEFLFHLINRCFGLAFRNGDFGETPQALSQYKFSPVYRSPLAKAQQLQDLHSMERFESGLGPLLEVNPEILDLYDLEAAIRKKAIILGVDVSLIRKQSDIDRMRKKRKEQADQQQVMEQQMMQQAQAANG